MSSSSASETDRLVEGFAGYLRRERGVSTFTVDLYVADVRSFLADLGNSDLRELTPADVSCWSEWLPRVAVTSLRTVPYSRRPPRRG